MFMTTTLFSGPEGDGRYVRTLNLQCEKEDMDRRSVIYHLIQEVVMIEMIILKGTVSAIKTIKTFVE